MSIAGVIYRDIRDLCGPMVDIGDTLWESACADSRSNAHGFVATLLFKCNTGIMSGPHKGYDEPVIAPLPDRQKWGRGYLRTRRGTIGVSWRCESNSFEMTVSLPKGMKASVLLPHEAIAVAVRKGEEPPQVRYEISETTAFTI